MPYPVAGSSTCSSSPAISTVSFDSSVSFYEAISNFVKYVQLTDLLYVLLNRLCINSYFFSIL